MAVLFKSVNAEYGGKKNQYINTIIYVLQHSEEEGSPSADAARSMYFYPAKGVQVETDTVLRCGCSGRKYQLLKSFSY